PTLQRGNSTRPGCQPPRPHRHLIINQFRGVTMFSRMRSLGLAAVVSALVATPALAGPQWISMELPANPSEQATRGAFLRVPACPALASSVIPLRGPHPLTPAPSGRGGTTVVVSFPSPEGRGDERGEDSKGEVETRVSITNADLTSAVRRVCVRATLVQSFFHL